MKYYLLGNGFDLYHRFPTKYNNFLHTVAFLVDHYDKSMNKIGKVFGDPRLQETDPWIECCYETHRPLFDRTPLDANVIQSLITGGRANMWFRYLHKSYNQDLGWIDFEKEVFTVIKAFEAFFQLCADERKTVFSVPNQLHPTQRYIIQEFSFFFRNPKMLDVAPEYLIETPLHSGHFELNTDLIAKELFDSLVELGNILQTYLKHFIQSHQLNEAYWKLESSSKKDSSPKDSLPFNPLENNTAITFNYTTLYENLYHPSADVCHIHGDLDSPIVLGINPTEEDEPEQMDTTFLRFKKYYQRVLNRTDDAYLKTISHIRSCKENGQINELIVFGHSLDQTDEDIIREIFDASDLITVYYFMPDFHSAIRNLISIFGRNGFNKLRREKSLTFKPQPDTDWGVYKYGLLKILLDQEPPKQSNA